MPSRNLKTLVVFGLRKRKLKVRPIKWKFKGSWKLDQSNESLKEVEKGFINSISIPAGSNCTKTNSQNGKTLTHPLTQIKHTNRNNPWNARTSEHLTVLLVTTLTVTY